MRQYLLEARGEVERAIALVRQEQREREARRVVEEAIAALGAGGEPVAGAETGAAAGSEGARPMARGASGAVGAPVAPGDKVRIPALGVEGSLESVQGGQATVLVRGRRVRVPSATLEPAQ